MGQPFKRYRLRAAIERIIQGGNTRYPFWSLATGLLAVSMIYRFLVRTRAGLYDRGVLPIHTVDRPVISVGNLTVGGTGKTPLIIFLAQQLKRTGRRVAVVSRGYRSQYEKQGAVISDGRACLVNSSQAGDEPYLLARMLQHCMVVVGQDRVAAANKAIAHFRPDVILLDDGFQHRRLSRDINLLLMDAQQPFGNGAVLPRGPLRESKQAMARADAVIFTRCGIAGLEDDIRHVMDDRSLPYFQTRHVPIMRGKVPAGMRISTATLRWTDTGLGETLDDRPVFAFSAIARNDTFVAALGAMGAAVAGTREFADHHPYIAEDIDAIVGDARRAGAVGLITTDKDFVRIPSETIFPLELIVMGVRIDFGDDRERWEQFCEARLEQIAANGSGRGHHSDKPDESS